AVFPYVPDGVTLANARGAHDPATAEWVVGAIFAQLRNLPRFTRAQRVARWDPAPSEPVAGKHVLIVGYRSSGAPAQRPPAGRGGAPGGPGPGGSGGGAGTC